MPTNVSNENEKMARFEHDVNTRVDKQIDEIMAISAEKSAEVIAEAEEKALSEAFEKLQTASKNALLDYKKAVTENKSENYHKVLKHREDLIDKVFEDVENKLIDFAKSDKYQSYLTTQLKNLKYKDGARVFLRTQDLPLADKLKTSTDFKDFEIDETIKLGGLSVCYGSTLENHSLDQALIDARKAFCANYKI
jgi:V/A-type H+-transporting ATPase subunit E